MGDTVELIEEINRKYGSDDWHPIDYFYENNFLQALAGMAHYDVLFVNALIDGMNLVTKEGPTVNKRDGVLLLSETVGAFEQLGEYALTVAPTDLEGTTRALYDALTMPADERKRRAIALKESIATEDLSHWVRRLLEDITELVQPVSTTT
jgi:trehalose 6-phosphate synthase